ncbi:MAG: hypothetical protein HY040_12865 [Planctomycetes bacterium]|nr:hypothetical protein [Planctomycetota bacterium]
MEHWRRTWREGIGPMLSRSGLEALRMALMRDDAQLVQNATTCPPALAVFADACVEAACAVGFCAWKGDNLATVAEVSAYFAQTCTAADDALGEPSACRHFLNWFDQTPRSEVRRLLLQEVNRLLHRSRPVAA